MPTEFQFDLTGGQLALDLANTVSRRDDPERRRDHLTSYFDLLSFVRQTHALSAKESQQLQTFAKNHPAEARHAYENAVTLREAIYRVFSAIAQHKRADPAELASISAATLEALGHRELKSRNGGYEWQWRSEPRNPLQRAVWPMAQAAAELLTSDELRIVRFCEAPDCEWLFMDRSRNRSRRWCDMTTCGNRQKARRHYQRAHG